VSANTHLLNTDPKYNQVKYYVNAINKKAFENKGFQG